MYYYKYELKYRKETEAFRLLLFPEQLKNV
jgi:hypothetical protein